MFLFSILTAFLLIFYPEEETLWDWEKIDVSIESQIKNFKNISTDFLWGTATAAHQVEGYNNNNQWALHESSGKVPKGEFKF